MPRLNADHDPVRPQSIFYGMPLAQELRVPGKFRGIADRRQPRQLAGQGGGRAERHSGLAHDKARTFQQRAERRNAAVQLGQFRAVRVRALRRADAHKMHITDACHLRVRTRETESAGVQAATQQGLKARLKEREIARR